jgi:hypothetical protein
MTNDTRPAKTREGLRRYLVEATGGCAIQAGNDGRLWPCGTCVLSLLATIGLDSQAPEYGERNGTPDRANEVWRALVQIRDAELPPAAKHNRQQES